MGLEDLSLREICEDEIKPIDEEPEEEMLLVTTIKNQTAEKKA